MRASKLVLVCVLAYSFSAQAGQFKMISPEQSTVHTVACNNLDIKVVMKSHQSDRFVTLEKFLVRNQETSEAKDLTKEISGYVDTYAHSGTFVFSCSNEKDIAYVTIRRNPSGNSKTLSIKTDLSIHQGIHIY